MMEGKMKKFMKILYIIFMMLIRSTDVIAWNVNACWCFWDGGKSYYLNLNSFTSRRPDKFPNGSTVIDQVALAAQYWNETGNEMAFKRSYDVKSCSTFGDICMLWDTEDTRLVGNDALTEIQKVFCSPSIYGLGMYYIRFNAEPSGVDWSVYYNMGDSYSNKEFYTVATHEFGHALGLDHNDSEYDNIIMSTNPSKYLMITEDDSFGAKYCYGLNDQPLRFISAEHNATNGLKNFSTEQVEYDWRKSHTQPFIASHPNPWKTTPLQFDFAVTWVNSSTRQVGLELIKMIDNTTHEVVWGPYLFNKQFSFQGPSVAVDPDGRILIAYRYEKENPDPDNLNEVYNNSTVRFIYSPANYSTWYGIMPDCKYSSSKTEPKNCRTQSTPVVAYSPATQKWVVAFNEAPRYFQDPFYKHRITIFVSDGPSGLYWNRNPWRSYVPYSTIIYSSYLPVGLNCLDPHENPYCLITYNSWHKHPTYSSRDGWMARIFQYGIKILNTSIPDSAVEYIPSSHFEWGQSGFAHTNVSASPYGWIMTRLNTPAFHDGLSWSYKDKANEITGSWTKPHSKYPDILSQQGYSIAYSYRKGVYRIVWTKE